MIEIAKSYLTEITPEDMPNEDTQWIAQTCGIDVAMKLMRNMGGVPLYIPKCSVKENVRRVADFPTTDTRLLASHCGIAVALKIMQEFPQSLLRIPKLTYSDWTKKIIKKHFNGSNAKQLAVELCVSESFVYKWHKRELSDHHRSDRSSSTSRTLYKSNGYLVKQFDLWDEGK